MQPSRDIARLIEIMAALRDPVGGCPWDLEQDFSTIRHYTIEEAYEVADAIERQDFADLREELGDLLLQVCADDPMVVSHTVRTLIKSVRSRATVRWTQRGFRHAVGTRPDGMTMRNLMGQVDGTVNPDPATPDFARQVWNTGEPAWLAGGTSLVLRRIRMELDTWDELDPPARDLVMGRRQSDGSPLTGSDEFDDADFDALDANGLEVIPPQSHVARARPRHGDERFLRRGYNYDDDGVGLLFAAYQADVDRQFVPVQRRLDEFDALNTWTTPVGSAVFVLPPGCGPDGYPGDRLLDG